MIDAAERQPALMCGQPHIPTLVRRAHDLDWMDDAACSGDMATFFSDDPADRRAARRVCLRCPVAGQCAAWRDRIKPTHGVWAGRTYRRDR